MKRLFIFAVSVYFAISTIVAAAPTSLNLAIYDSLVAAIGRDTIFSHEVEKYKKFGFDDRLVLFAGRSTFAGWKTLEQTFSKYGAINRAIGGMVLGQVIWHSDALTSLRSPSSK